jgi:hypothetical protein
MTNKITSRLCQIRGEYFKFILHKNKENLGGTNFDPMGKNVNTFGEDLPITALWKVSMTLTFSLFLLRILL